MFCSHLCSQKAYKVTRRRILEKEVGKAYQEEEARRSIEHFDKLCVMTPRLAAEYLSIEKLGKEYLAFFHTLQELPEIKFQMTPEQGVDFNKHFALLQADYVGLFGDDTVASVQRLATSTFRIAMILSALRIWGDGDTDSPRI